LLPRSQNQIKITSGRNFLRAGDHLFNKHFQTSISMASSTILREIAELSNPSALDYDPEDLVPDYEVSESDEPEDVNAGREHYVQVR
jgi:hypothetical protein